MNAIRTNRGTGVGMDESQNPHLNGREKEVYNAKGKQKNNRKLNEN